MTKIRDYPHDGDLSAETVTQFGSAVFSKKRFGLFAIQIYISTRNLCSFFFGEGGLTSLCRYSFLLLQLQFQNFFELFSYAATVFFPGINSAYIFCGRVI